jgi:hypothetical protein
MVARKKIDIASLKEQLDSLNPDSEETMKVRQKFHSIMNGGDKFLLCPLEVKPAGDDF